MKKILFTLAILACALIVPAQQNTPGKPALSSLAWLAGTWVSEENGRVIHEQWMKPDGGTMPGMSRTVARGRTVEFEFMLLRETAAGDIQYEARPSGQTGATFKLIKQEANEIVFENPNHDFPQRILYKLTGEKLFAAIEGTENGKARRIEFNFKRAVD